MNLVYENPSTPVRLLLVNPVGKTAAMLGIKAMRGILFGPTQLIDLILLVYSNDYNHAERLKWELEAGGFPCNNSITITSDIPRLSDADVFIFVTSLPNPNSLDFHDVDTIEVFDSLYLLMTVAKNFEMPPPQEPPEERIFKKKNLNPVKQTFKPVIVTDGLVALDIVRNYSKNLPDDIFFCPTPIVSVAVTILADHLKVPCNTINDVHVWAANDDIFHVEVDKPVYHLEKTSRRSKCEWEYMADHEFEELEIDATYFSAAWLKKEFIKKIAAVTIRHPHGCIYKSTTLSRTIQQIWRTRSRNPLPEFKFSLGVISDGSLETVKGLPYVLPLIFTGDKFAISTTYKDCYHLKQEIKRINKVVVTHHKKLMSFCKKFYQRNVIMKQFLATSNDESPSEASALVTESSNYEKK